MADRLAKAALRCVGLGECRQHDAGSMCPTYMVTLEEKHSTRGRAHMLFELLQGEVVRDGWQDEHVKEIARPVPFLQGLQVGLPDQRGHRHVQGGVPVALLRAQVAPAAGVRVRPGGPLGAAGFAGAGDGEFAVRRAGSERALLRHCAAAATAAACRQQLPALGAARNGVPAPPGGSSPGEVILWADTFNNYFHPETSRAALEVLRAAGLRVTVPRAASLLRAAAVRFRHARSRQRIPAAT